MHLPFVLVINLMLLACNAYPNTQPTIGVLLETVENSPGQYKAQLGYQTYIEQGGGGAVPIFPNQTDDYYTDLISRLNGVLLPGGGVDLISSYYGKAAYKIFQMAKDINKAGTHFPIWGTCLGMQEMMTWPFNPRQNPSTGCIDTEGVSLPLKMSSYAPSSKLFGDLPDNIKQYLTKENVTANFHRHCITLQTYQSHSQLYEFYNLLSTNYDGKGVEFVSTVEAKEYPFYGVQWHPEKNNFFHRPNSTINTSLDAVLVGQHFANFLVQQAKMNHHSFKSYEEEHRFMFNNYQTKFKKDFSEYYYLTDANVPKFDS